jgi:uncharacterized peroxidase-related enzyme
VTEPRQRHRASILKSRRIPLNLRDIFGFMPHHAEGVVRYYQTVMRAPSPLTPGEREFIYSYCSGLAGCHYAHTSHKTCAIALGIDRRIFDTIFDDFEAAPIRAKLKPILRFARKLALAPAVVEPSDADPIYAAGWSEKAVIDAIAVVSLTAWINRILNGFCAWAPDRHHRAAGRRLARNGYAPVAREVSAQLSAGKASKRRDQR